MVQDKGIQFEKMVKEPS